MEKMKGLGWEHFIAIISLVWVANVAVAHYWGYPFLYCWVKPAAFYLYSAWGILCLYLVMLYVAYQLLRNLIAKALIGALLAVAIIELPRIFDYIFNVGGTCG